MNFAPWVVKFAVNINSSSGRRGPLIAVGTVIGVFLAIGCYLAYTTWNTHQQTVNRNAIASGYLNQGLSNPFKLQSHLWQPNSGTWYYVYTADATGSGALGAAETQTSQGGYQVIATRPDVITPSHATLYRDLITGNVMITVQIAASPGATYSKGPITADVTVSSMGN